MKTIFRWFNNTSPYVVFGSVAWCAIYLAYIVLKPQVESLDFLFVSRGNWNRCHFIYWMNGCKCNFFFNRQWFKYLYVTKVVVKPLYKCALAPNQSVYPRDFIRVGLKMQNCENLDLNFLELFPSQKILFIPVNFFITKLKQKPAKFFPISHLNRILPAF